MSQQFDFGAIDTLIHSPVRLAVMALLVTGDEVEFTRLRDLLGVTDGNLATHLRKLEAAGYIECEKTFLDRKPRTTYRIAPDGRSAFENHVAQLEKIVGKADPS